jgi:hypothetical protein
MPCVIHMPCGNGKRWFVGGIMKGVIDKEVLYE